MVRSKMCRHMCSSSICVSTTCSCARAWAWARTWIAVVLVHLLSLSTIESLYTFHKSLELLWHMFPLVQMQSDSNPTDRSSCRVAGNSCKVQRRGRIEPCQLNVVQQLHTSSSHFLPDFAHQQTCAAMQDNTFLHSPVD